MTIAIPTSQTHLTAAWLTQALQPNFPGAEVTSVHTGTILHGTATKVRLLLEYNEQGHRHRLPPTLWFKGGLEAHSDTTDMLIVYANEASFFQQLAPLLSNTLPRAYAAAIDPATNHSFILLEDLLARNATFGHASRPVSPAVAAQFLEELAILHGRFWKAPEKVEHFSWLGGGGSLLQSCDVMMSRATWERSMGLPRGEMVRGPLRDFDRMRGAILHVLQSDVERANCLVHGDSHLGNSFSTPDGSVGFLDWQSHFWGMWAHDVAYFLITSLTIEDRRSAERDLLEQYVRLGNEHGMDLSMEAAWLEYRRHALYSCAWSMCLPEWQAEETCCLVTERAIAATQDLNTLDAW